MGAIKELYGVFSGVILLRETPPIILHGQEYGNMKWQVLILRGLDLLMLQILHSTKHRKTPDFWILLYIKVTQDFPLQQ